MRQQSKELKKTVATLFDAINTNNIAKGINAQYKYEVKYIDLEEGEHKKAVEVSIIMKELGYRDIILTTFGYVKPNNLDNFTFEYNVFIYILTSLVETSLITYTELGKSLNKDKKFQKEAINSLGNDKEINSNTNK